METTVITNISEYEENVFMGMTLVNNKGGVGKTTLTINLAATLVQEGKKVAMVDFDPQCSLTIGAGYKLDELTYTITDVLNAVVNGKIETIENTWLEHEEGMHLMPADKNLVGFESSLLQEYGRELFLKRYIDTIKDQFDYIIIDTQGAVSVLLINVLLASDSVLIPMQAEFHSVGALDMLLGAMDQLKRNLADARFKIEGFIPQMVDIRTKDSRMHLDFIKEHYHEKYRVFDYIPFTVRLKEIAHMGGSVFRLEPEGKAAAALQGKTVVVFESLMCGDKEIAVHADIEDKNQTVTFREPKIGTSAAGVDGKKEMDVGSKVTLVDTVSYDNLAVGESYTLKGILMDKEMGAPLLVDGKEVIAEATFIPETTNGKVEVSFTFNSTALIGKTVVVFESLMCGEKEIAVHADIEDKNQTVTFKEPKIGTSAADQGGSKTVPLAESVTVIDTVTYENLVVGESYLLKGVLMDKAAGQPLVIDGKQVTAETLFEASKSSGSVEVWFTFNSLKLEGKTLVVFESLECAGKEIAVHADINDEAQSVGIGVSPSGGGAKTGRVGLPFVLLLIAIGAGVTGAVVLLRKKNKRKEEVTVNK